MKFSRITLSLLLAIAPSIYADETVSTQDVEKIIVTGDFSRMSLDQVAQSASVIGPEIIDMRQATHAEDVLNSIANVNLSAGASRARFMQIRGIGERSQFAEPLNASVGIMLDGLDISGIGALATLFDVSQVEVLRGPQATAHGANGLAGLINIVSNAPTAEAEGYAKFGLAQDNTYLASGAYSQALSQELNARVAFQKYQSNGFVENTFLGRDDTNGIDETNARIAFSYAISDQHSLHVNLLHAYIDNGYDAFSLDNDNRTRSDEPGKDRTKANGVSVQSNTEYTWGNLIVSAGVIDTESLYSYDEDWTFVGFHPWEYSSVDAYSRERDNQTVSIKAYSHQDLNKPHWTLGTQFKRNDESLLREYTYAESDFTSEYSPQTVALFGQYNYPLAPNWMLEAGMRLERFSADYSDNSGFTEEQSESLVGGKLALSYRTNTATYYGSISRGYKAGGFNPSEAVANDQRTFDAEYNWNYEFGAKFVGEAFNARVAVFHMDRKNTHISDFAVIQGPDNSVQFIDIIDNADNGTNRGAEIEWRWDLAPEVSIGANLGLLDAYFSGFTRADGTAVQEQQQAQSPRGTFHVFADIALSDTWGLYLAGEGRSSHRFSDGHDEINPAYTLVNATLTRDLGPYAVSFWVNNLFDRQFYTRGFGGFSNDPRDYYATPEPYYQIGNGRRAGVAVNYRF